MAIYLDNCCLNRPYDDQSAPRVRLEAEAIDLILKAVAQRRLDIIWSVILDLENNQNPFEERRAAIEQWKLVALANVPDSAEVRNRARELHAHGFKPLDALHLACAISAQASHFLTVDDRILNKRQHVREISIVSPLDFVQYSGEML